MLARGGDRAAPGVGRVAAEAARLARGGTGRGLPHGAAGAVGPGRRGVLDRAAAEGGPPPCAGPGRAGGRPAGRGRRTGGIGAGCTAASAQARRRRRAGRGSARATVGGRRRDGRRGWRRSPRPRRRSGQRYVKTGRTTYGRHFSKNPDYCLAWHTLCREKSDRGSSLADVNGETVLVRRRRTTSPYIGARDTLECSLSLS